MTSLYKPLPWKCWNCDRVGHLAKDCRQPRKESSGRSGQSVGRSWQSLWTTTKVVRSSTTIALQYLLSDSEDSADSTEVRQIRVPDLGSRSWHGKLDLDVTFQDRTMKTAVYIKMDTPESLLLVCCQFSLDLPYTSNRKQSVKTNDDDPFLHFRFCYFRRLQLPALTS